MDCINLLLQNNVDLTVQDKVVSLTKAMQIQQMWRFAGFATIRKI